MQGLALYSPDASYLVATSSETASEASSVGKTDEVEDQKIKLNDFLMSCKVKPVGNKSWLDWSSASDSTKRRYLDCAADAIVAILNVLSKENTSHLWEGLQTSKVVNEKLNMVSSSLPSEKAYLEALAESYKIAGSWDTRRQILSIIAGVASYKSACEYIPGLTSFRYTVASLHRVQYGSGAPLPLERQTRLCIKRDQLDHFLSFITSPHLVQDLPFGERNLVLSTGETITVPNVIRTMIPRRIVKQYVSFCQETGFKTVEGLEQKWEHDVQDSLKAAKMYLKGDYKVNYFLRTLCRIKDAIVSFSEPLRQVLKKQRSTYTLKPTQPALPKMD